MSHIHSRSRITCLLRIEPAQRLSEKRRRELEPAQGIVAVDAGCEHLDRHVAPEVAVVGDEDPSHPSSADLPLDPVALVDSGRRCGFGVRDHRTGRGGPADSLQRLAVYHSKGQNACPARSRKRWSDGTRPGPFAMLYRPMHPDIAVQDTERWADL